MEACRGRHRACRAAAGRSARDGSPPALLQCWVAATPEGEDAAPAFTHWPAADVPARAVARHRPAAHCRARLRPRTRHAAGPACAIAVLRLANRMRFEFRAEYAERAVYVMSGHVEIGGERVAPHAFASLGDTGRTVYVDALEPSVLALFAGDPIGERTLWWNFVARDAARIDAAKARWAAGGFPPVLGDDERMPLPAD
ncbi:MAG: hypothetical protein C6Y20_21490 [Tagaea sp. CACIAM 22H2]|nr:hypothetical protein [Tagaea sp. CACIAM 22H2]